MPITLRKFNAQVKDPETGDMVPAGLLSSDSIEAIEEAETAAVAAVEGKQAVAEAAIELKGQTTIASIPADYTELSNEVDDVNTEIDDVKNAIEAEDYLVVDGYVQYDKQYFINGDWSETTALTKVGSNRALRINTPIQIRAGDKMTTKPGQTVTYLGWNLWNNGEKVETGYQYTTYKRTIANTTITFAHDGELVIAVANGPNPGNSSNITPADMDATIIIQNSLAKRIENNFNNEISGINDNISALYNYTTKKIIDETPSANANTTFIFYPYNFIKGQTYIAKVKFTEFNGDGNRKYSLRTTTGQYGSSAYLVQMVAVVDATNPVIGQEYEYTFVATTQGNGDEAKYFCIEINSNSGETSSCTLEVYSIKAEDAQTELDKLDYITATDIVSLNHDLPTRISEGSQILVRNQYQSTPVSPFKLLHFSDIHAAGTNLARLVELKSSLGNTIDDTICTGDMVANNYSATCMDFWDAVDGAEKILMVVGNHELADGSHGYSSDQIGQTAAYEKYFAPYASDQGVTMAGENLTYWYKDYSAKKMRLIGLNYLLTGDALTAQNTWLASRLSEAKTAGYAVIIAEHCPGNSFTNIECNFTTVGYPWTYNEFPTSIQDTVAAFMENDGEFVCYLCGHSHRDYVGFNSSYPDQIFVSITAAQTSGVDNDLYRANGTKSQDAANVFIVDTLTKTIKLIRVGADTDCYLRGRNLCSIKYTDKTVVANS